ncbi:MAG TPA: acetolactate decarboxylase [Thermodesulfovibrionales bacterium]|jgi:alpha-acetolactate decarboxylase|nr:acetolactate decarboxylase [Thermodesulfovibrionales bacterium]
MKGLMFLIALVLFIGPAAHVIEAAMPFEFNYYGNFREITKKKMPEGAVELGEELFGPHTYGIGIVGNFEGEITALDGEVLLNYGRDGLNKTLSQIPKGEKATLLVTAQVERWQKITIPFAMSEHQLYTFVLEQARKLGLDTKAPFPFLIKGIFSDVVWSVVSGIDTELDTKLPRLSWKKVVGYREEAEALMIGFYPASLRAEISHPGESWHVHIFFWKEKDTGHVSAFSVLGGSELDLPVR